MSVPQKFWILEQLRFWIFGLEILDLCVPQDGDINASGCVLPVFTACFLGVNTRFISRALSCIFDKDGGKEGRHGEGRLTPQQNT